MFIPDFSGFISFYILVYILVCECRKESHKKKVTEKKSQEIKSQEKKSQEKVIM